MNDLKLIICNVLLFALIPIFLASQASATEMVYTPINPSFGGNPNNGPGLMSIAQVQNGFRAPTISAIDNFNNTLQQAILNRLTTQSLNTMFGTKNTLSAGDYNTSGYAIHVSDNGNGQLTITTTDNTSGAVATFIIDSNTP